MAGGGEDGIGLVAVAKARDMERVTVDTTVQPKAVTHPTDAKLMHKAIVMLGKLAREHGVPLRQSYIRVAKQALGSVLTETQALTGVEIKRTPLKTC